MTTEHKGIEFFVGLFLLVGFAVLAVMVVKIGRLGQGMQRTYPVVVQFPNASGLIKGSDVLLSGALVGSVAEAPRLTGANYAVAVELNIKEGIDVPRTSVFQVRISGLLGDAYVDIVPPAKYTADDFAKPGEMIIGAKLGGFDELSAKGGELVDKLNKETLTKLSESLDEFKTAATNFNQRLLTEKNLKNIEDTFTEFAKTAKDLDAVMKKVEETLDAAKSTMKTADSSAGELKSAIGDLRKMADTATKTVDSAKVLINKASSGEGTVGALISDKQMAADLRALVTNLRRSGVLFYKDRQPAATPVPAATPIPVQIPTTTQRKRR
jgi:ABC-type transporter Mla subunit MlaD